jgi:hypothetical protein
MPTHGGLTSHNTVILNEVKNLALHIPARDSLTSHNTVILNEVKNLALHIPATTLSF